MSNSRIVKGGDAYGGLRLRCFLCSEGEAIAYFTANRLMRTVGARQCP
ncbi:hypothetical protein [uncultured Nostoc sp.]|nr:hypothetical protein [uncultured Nostoc sp.]